MKIPIQIPSMGESIIEVVIGQVFADTGKVVKVDAEILEIETDKLNQTLYAPQAGQVSLEVKGGEVVKVGQTVGYIETNAISTSETPKEEVKVEKKSVQPIQKEEKQNIKQEEPQGSIRESKADYIDSLKSSKKPEQTESKAVSISENKKEILVNRETRSPLSHVRKVIASRMLESQKEMATLTTFNEVDLNELMTLREKYKESFQKKYDLKLGLMPFFVKAVVSALEAFPQVNAYIDSGDLVQRHYFDIGIAVGTEKGTFVPVLRNCNRLSFSQIEAEIQKFAKLSRENGLKVDDLQGAGFTITNGGVYGSLLSTPIPSLKQCAILGMHKIEKRAVVIQDQIVIRPMMYLALSYDHRLIDGRESVSFLVHVKNMLEDPSRLLLEV